MDNIGYMHYERRTSTGILPATVTATYAIRTNQKKFAVF